MSFGSPLSRALLSPGGCLRRDVLQVPDEQALDDVEDDDHLLQQVLADLLVLRPILEVEVLRPADGDVELTTGTVLRDEDDEVRLSGDLDRDENRRSRVLLLEDLSSARQDCEPHSVLGDCATDPEEVVHEAAPGTEVLVEQRGDLLLRCPELHHAEQTKQALLVTSDEGDDFTSIRRGYVDVVAPEPTGIGIGSNANRLEHFVSLLLPVLFGDLSTSTLT